MAEEKQAHAGEQLYDEKFYANITNYSVQSATRILPAITKFIKPRSVIDIGCGRGGWLSVWQKNGAVIFGVDGDYVDRTKILIAEKSFQAWNLENRINVNARFDLAMTLEVAEHLTPGRAESFVEDLTRLSDVVMFSAAIPGQGGTNHINEQWQSYWAEIFSKFGYVCIDCIRPQIWHDNLVSQHYRQNILMYVKFSELYKYPRLAKYHVEHETVNHNLIHPQVWLERLIEFNKFYQDVQDKLQRR